MLNWQLLLQLLSLAIVTFSLSLKPIVGINSAAMQLTATTQHPKFHWCWNFHFSDLFLHPYEVCAARSVIKKKAFLSLLNIQDSVCSRWNPVSLGYKPKDSFHRTEWKKLWEGMSLHDSSNSPLALGKATGSVRGLSCSF